MPKNKPLKRPNSTGTVSKLSGRRRKPWMVRVSKGHDAQGKRIREVVGCYVTKTEALKVLAMYNINPIERPQIKLHEVYEEWSQSKYSKISISMVNGYKAAYARLQPLYKMKFRDIKTVHYQTIIDNLNMSRSSLNKIKALVGQLYKHAMMNDIVSQNYAQFIVLPKEHKTEKPFFNDLHIKKLQEHDDDHIVKIILIMIYTGFRPTATLELTRFSYDPINRVLTGGIKTDAGMNRPVPIHPAIQPYIDYFIDLNGYTLLCNPNGYSYTLDNFRTKYYYPTLEKYDLPLYTPHICRHTFLSLLAMRDANKVMIQKLGGHTNYAFTADNYTHVEIDRLRQAIEKI